MYCLGQSNCNTKPKNLSSLTLRRSCGRLTISYNICWSRDSGSSHLGVLSPRAFEASALRKEKESPKFCRLLFVFVFNPYHLPPSVSFSFPSFLSFFLPSSLPPILIEIQFMYHKIHPLNHLFFKVLALRWSILLLLTFHWPEIFTCSTWIQGVLGNTLPVTIPHSEKGSTKC